jgi:CBS domain-containing protein
MQVSTFMTTAPVTITPDAKLTEALALMDEHRVRHLPVVDGDLLVGVVSDRDALESPDSRVFEVMRSKVMTVGPDETVVSISVEMSVGRVGCLPVVDTGKLVGIVTEFDLIRLYTMVCQQDGMSGEVDPPIERIMTHQVVGLEATDRLADAEAAIATIDVRHAPVVSNGRLIGIISDRDLRRARGEGLPSDRPIADVMSQNVRTLAPADSLSAAAKLMTEFKISALPIVAGELLGIVTSSDIIDHCMETLRPGA